MTKENWKALIETMGRDLTPQEVEDIKQVVNDMPYELLEKINYDDMTGNNCLASLCDIIENKFGDLYAEKHICPICENKTDILYSVCSKCQKEGK